MSMSDAPHSAISLPNGASTIQLTTNHKVSTPANWKNGEDVILAGTVSDEEGKKLYPDSFKRINSYIRTVAQPK